MPRLLRSDFLPLLALPIALVSNSSAAQEFRNPEAVAPPIGPYSHVAIVPAGSNLLFLAGQVGNQPDGTMAATPEQQYEHALRNIAALLKAERAGPHNIVKLTTYLVQPIAPESAQKIREAVFGAARPASTLVYVVRLARPDILVEVEAVAVQPTDRPG